MFKLTPVILHNFIAERATRRYPLETRMPFDGTRGRIRNDMASCTFCGVCALKCPSQCIVVDKEKQIWQWDPFACIYCGNCVEACRQKSLRQDSESLPSTRERHRITMHRDPVPDAPVTTSESIT